MSAPKRPAPAEAVGGESSFVMQLAQRLEHVEHEVTRMRQAFEAYGIPTDETIHPVEVAHRQFVAECRERERRRR